MQGQQKKYFLSCTMILNTCKREQACSPPPIFPDLIKVQINKKTTKITIVFSSWLQKRHCGRRLPGFDQEGSKEGLSQYFSWLFLFQIFIIFAIRSNFITWDLVLLGRGVIRLLMQSSSYFQPIHLRERILTDGVASPVLDLAAKGICAFLENQSI